MYVNPQIGRNSIYGYGDVPVLECSSFSVNIETGTSPFRYGCFVFCWPFSHVSEHSSQQEFDEDIEATDDQGMDACDDDKDVNLDGDVAIRCSQ